MAIINQTGIRPAFVDSHHNGSQIQRGIGVWVEERHGHYGEADRSSKAPFPPRAAAASPQPPARRPRAARP